MQTLLTHVTGLLLEISGAGLGAPGLWS